MSFVERLSPRLNVVAQFVRQGVRLCDVGCDHGKLIAALAADNVISGGVACDLNIEPLKKAERYIADLGFADRVECRLGDGLSVVNAEEADDVVIAGMGGELILSIITACEWSRDGAKRFIVQSMTKDEILREGLFNSGFFLVAERAVVDNGRAYSVMCWEYSGVQTVPTLTEKYLGLLSCDTSSEAEMYRDRVRGYLTSALNGMRRSNPELASGIEEMLEAIT